MNKTKPEQLKKATKPPLGLLPRYFHYDERRHDIESAIYRYKSAKLPIPEEWKQELKIIKALIPCYKNEFYKENFKSLFSPVRSPHSKTGKNERGIVVVHEADGATIQLKIGKAVHGNIASDLMSAVDAVLYFHKL